MNSRVYAVAFLLVLVVGCAGAYLGLRLVVGNPPSFLSRPAWTPAPAGTSVPTTAGTPGTEPGQPTTPTTFPVITPAIPALTPVIHSTPTSTPSIIPAPEGTETATPTSTTNPAYAFVQKGQVRHTASGGECPGDSIRGTVVDQSGNPLPGVRLWLVDEYGNEDFKTSKGEQVDLGKYDFPIFGPPRKFYLTVLNGVGHPDSPRIEIIHKRPPNEGFACHFVDWQRTR